MIMISDQQSINPASKQQGNANKEWRDTIMNRRTLSQRTNSVSLITTDNTTIDKSIKMVNGYVYVSIMMTRKT